jgi:hypothetical protein
MHLDKKEQSNHKSKFKTFLSTRKNNNKQKQTEETQTNRQTDHIPERDLRSSGMLRGVMW